MTTPRSERSEKLLPCPFCGGKADDGRWGTGIAFCQGCRASASIESWNRRAPSHPEKPEEGAAPKEGGEKDNETAVAIALSWSLTAGFMAQQKVGDPKVLRDAIQKALSAARAESKAETLRELSKGDRLMFRCKCGREVDTSPIPMYEAKLEAERKKVEKVVEAADAFRRVVVEKRDAATISVHSFVLADEIRKIREAALSALDGEKRQGQGS